MPKLPEAKGQEMIITLSGANPFLLKQRLDELTGEFNAKYGDLALERIDGEEVGPQQVLDAVGNLPLLSPRKMVVVKSLGSNKAAADSIEQIISATHEGVDVIFYEPQIDKRTSYFKGLKAKTQFEELNGLEPHELAKWLVQEAARKGASLKPSDASYLIERVGPNQMLLANELEKLAIYNKQISRENIELLSAKNPQSKIFDLLDAAFSGNKKRALELYDEQRAQKVEPQEIIAMLAWQLRLIAAVKYAHGKKPVEVAQDLKMSPYPVTKALSVASRITERMIEERVEELLRIDRLAKTSPVDLDDALKYFVISL